MLQIPDMMDFTPKPSETTESFKPVISNELEVKQKFGLALGKGKNPFDAALEATDNNTNISLWVSQRWLTDPIVLEFKEKTVVNSNPLLDADQLAAKLLQMSVEKDRSNNFYILEGKDRLKALELYAKVRGFDKSNTSTNNITFKQINVRLIEPIKKEQVQHSEINEEQIINNKLPTPKLKLVS